MRYPLIIITLIGLSACTTTTSIGLEPGSWSINRTPSHRVESSVSPDAAHDSLQQPSPQPPSATGDEPLSDIRATDGDY